MFAWKLTRPYPTMRHRPLVLGHRGASVEAPENTVEAFREALRQGADGVELDVMRCGSGELVVCHDEWLDRLAGEHLEVRRTSYGKLCRIDVGRRFSARFAGAHIPTLAEALAVLPRSAVCNIELKCETLRDDGLSYHVARELARSEAVQDFVLSSFNPLSLAKARLFAPRLPVAMLVEASRNLPVRELGAHVLRACALHVEHPLCSRESVRRWHEAGFKVGAWTVDDPSDLERCCEAKVDAVITNRPALARAVMRRLGLGA